jgi:hypothetical protein
MTKLSISILIFLFCVPFVVGVSSDLFIDYLATKIFSDCSGKNLIIKEPFIINTMTNETISLIPSGSYDYGTVRLLVKLFGGLEPWDFFQGTCQDKGVTIGGSRDGCGLLKCGENVLDVNQYTYFWNGVRVDVPKETTNIAINNSGNVVQDVSNCVIEQNQIRTKLENCTIEQKQITTELNICNSSLVTTQKALDSSTFLTDILTSFIVGGLGSSATFYLIFNPRGAKNKKTKAVVILVVCVVISLVVLRLIS